MHTNALEQTGLLVVRCLRDLHARCIEPDIPTSGIHHIDRLRLGGREVNETPGPIRQITLDQRLALRIYGRCGQ